MILNYLLRLYTKQFVLFMNLLTGRTQKVRFFVAIKFILKTYIWLVAVPIRSHTSNVALVALGVLKLWAICNSAFCNWAFFALGVVLHWAFFCIGRCVFWLFCFWVFCSWVFCTHFVFLLVSSWVFLV